VLAKRVSSQACFKIGGDGRLIPVPPPDWHWGERAYELACLRGELD
jgi:hypothetical protein